jgi:hypothetical protein
LKGVPSNRDRFASQIHDLETQIAIRSTWNSDLQLTIQKLIGAGKVRFGITFATASVVFQISATETAEDQTLTTS